MMGSALASFVIGLLASIIKGVVSDWRRDKALESKGAADAALETSRRIQERADAQHTNDMADRGGATDVARRLRERLRAERSG